MQLYRILFLALISAGIFGLTANRANATCALDWPQYRGPAADGIAAAVDGAIDPAGEFEVHWKVPTALGFSSFSIANGRVFTLIAEQDAEVLLALDETSGAEIWRAQLGSNKYRGGGGAGAPNNRGGDGPRTTPTVDGDRVYVYDAAMNLVCFDATDGSEVWRHSIITEFSGRKIAWENATAPITNDRLLFVSGGGAGQSLLAFDKTTGKIAWKTGDEKMTHATPVLRTINDNPQVIFFMQSGLISVRPDDGKELWRTPFPFRVSSAASPVVENDLVYCSAGYGMGAGLFRVNDTATPEKIWTKPNRLMNHWSTPVVVDGHLYGIYKVKKYGKAPLQCVELKTGEIKWSQNNFGPGNCILVGDKLAVLSDAGALVVVKASPDQYTELARQKVLKGKCWSTPAFSDGKIYIRSTEEGACVSFKPVSNDH